MLGLPHNPLVVQPYVTVDDGDRSTLRRLNLGAGLLHLASGIVMLILATDFTLPVTAFGLNGPPGTPVSEGDFRAIADVPLAPLAASFAFLSAFFHLLIISPGVFDRYVGELRHGRNRFRWVEYSLSSTLMILLIMLISGITDAAALIGVGFANISMILFGWIMEMVNRSDTDGGGVNDQVWWTPFWFGCIAGAGPWLAFVAYLWINIAQGDEGPPGFVYGILVSIFVLFNCFAVNQWLQYRARGRFADYLFGERIYIVLSFVAKTALVWQVYANVLVG